MQEITFDELSTLKQPSASLRTALDKISAALGSVGDAGQQARSVVDELRVSLRAAAAQSVKSARSLAKFDEINRLSAPAEDKTAALEKQKKAAEAAAKAEKAARSTTGTAARRSGTAGSDLSGLTAVWQSVLESLRGAWADFWAYLQEFFAPFAAAWQTVWQGLSAAAVGVWEQLCAALSTVVQPALALLDTVWQGLWAGMQQAWAVYGQPIATYMKEYRVRRAMELLRESGGSIAAIAASRFWTVLRRGGRTSSASFRRCGARCCSLCWCSCLTCWVRSGPRTCSRSGTS